MNYMKVNSVYSSLDFSNYLEIIYSNLKAPWPENVPVRLEEFVFRSGLGPVSGCVLQLLREVL